MLILTIKTDQPTAEVGLYENEKQLGYEAWQAHRELSVTIHTKIQDLLNTAGKDWDDIEGIVFFKGPGSFTGLRIGASVVNALAAGSNICAVSTNKEEWINEGMSKLMAGDNEILVIPEYGSEPKTTKPKK